MSLPNEMRNFIAGGSRIKYPKATPPTNISVIQGSAIYTYLFSRRVSAGETNITIWYTKKALPAQHPGKGYYHVCAHHLGHLSENEVDVACRFDEKVEYLVSEYEGYYSGND